MLSRLMSKFYCIDSELALKCVTRKSERPELRKGKGLMATRAYHHTQVVESIPWAVIGH